MIITVKGSVNFLGQKYFSCADFSALQVKVYNATLSGSEAAEIATITLDPSGEFNQDVTSASGNIVVKLYDDSLSILIAESRHFCHHDEVNVFFDYDPSLYGDPVYNQIVAKINAVAGANADDLASLSEEELENLSCLSCVSLETVNRLRAAGDLRVRFDAFKTDYDFSGYDYEPAATAMSDFFNPAIVSEENSRGLLFALSPRSLNGNLYPMFAFSADQLEALLQTAVDAREIGADLNTVAYRNLLVGARNALMLNSEDDGGYFGGKLIHMTSGGYGAKVDLLDQALDQGSLNSIIDSHPTPLEVEIIDLMKMGGHLQNYTPFMQTVVDTLGRSPDYYQLTLDPTGWPDITTFPSQYGSPAEYSASIVASVANQEPTAAIARSLNGLGSIDWAPDVYNKLTDSTNRNFDIKNQTVKSFFTVKATPSAPNEVTDDMLKQIEALQRTTNLTGETTSLTVTEALIDSEMDSAFAISTAGKVDFMRTMDEHSVDSGTAERVYQGARSTYETLSLLAVQHKLYDSPGAGLPSAARGIYTGGGANQLPDLESLFGTLNTCECSECQSVFSAGAYLADTLHWLKRDVAGTPYFAMGKGYDYLMQYHNTVTNVISTRRLDISKLLLCCDNTNTLVPYIDLVNEILSYPLLLDLPSPITPNYTELQTTKTTEEILVEPEHRKRNAEVMLASVYYPWILPFTPSFYESIVYLKELEKPYHELVNDFSKIADQYNTTQWAYAFFEINTFAPSGSISEAVLINTAQNPGSPTTTYWKNYWGFKTTNASAYPTVSLVMKTASLTLDELLELLTAKFIEPAHQLEIQPNSSDPCDFDQYIFTIAYPFTQARADRFMRFLRLKRKSGLTTLELDMAIKVLGTGGNTLDATLIKKTGSALAFCQKHNLTFLEYLEWFTDAVYTEMWSATDSAYFKDKYQNPLLPQSILTYFSNTANYISVTFTNDHKQTFSTVWGISIPQLNSILSYFSISGLPPTTLPNRTTNRSWFSLVAGYAGLLRIFEIDSTQMTAIFKLIGDPFNTTTYPDTQKGLWEFERKLAKLRELTSDPVGFIDIIEGTGYYALTANVSTTDFNNEAKACWEKIEAAYQLAHKANPEKEFSTSSPYMPLVSTDTDFFKGVMVDTLILTFPFDRTTAFNIIDRYNTNTGTNWYQDIISDPDNKQGLTREWATGRNFNAKFTPMFRIFTRIQLLADICGLDKSGITYAVNNAAVTSIPAYLYALPGTPFYWVTNSFATADGSKFLWIADATKQSADLQMNIVGLTKTSQQLYFEAITLFYNRGVGNIGGGALGQGDIDTIYNSLGKDSPMRRVSIQRFYEMFARGQAKIDVTNDMVDVVSKVEHFTQQTFDKDIKFIDAWNWVWTSSAGSTASDLSTYSEDIRRVLNSYYPQFESWSNFIVPFQNDFREKLRDALVAYHISQNDFKDENDLFTYYLIDNQMSSCMMTSRIIAAHASVQLFAHRALMGLEPDVQMDATNKKEWEWRKNYRVWEAARKVFCYPENWIDPSLRIGKSYQFKDAEEVLQQDDINDKNTELAFSTYLTELNEIARLDVRAVYNEIQSYQPYTGAASIEVTPGDGWAGWTNYTKVEDNQLVTHVFARSWKPPYKHYHRTLFDGIWSPWEKIDIELDTDHLIPVIFNRKLYLFFPIFIESIYNNSSIRKYYEVKMGFIKYDAGKWSNKKILDGKLFAGNLAFEDLENKEENLKYITAVYDRISSAAGSPSYLIPDYPNTTSAYLPSQGNAISALLLTYMAGPARNFSFVSMEKKDFFFWGEVKSDGDLIIHVRRGLDMNHLFGGSHPDTYFAYEYSFKIRANDERLEIIPPVVSAPDAGRVHKTIFRPPWSESFFQQIRRRPADPSIWLSTKTLLMSDTQNIAVEIFGQTAGQHILTYPDQFKHAYSYTPFFYADDRRSFMIERDFSVGKSLYMPCKVTLNEHPLVWKMIRELNRFGVEGLLTSNDPGLKRQQASEPHPYELKITNPGPVGSPSIPLSYVPKPLVGTLPALNYNFDATGTYSLYNWETFFHSVSLIGQQLRVNGKYKEAYKWLNYIFDPANRDVLTGTPTPPAMAKYWKVKPFLIDATTGSIQYLMRVLAAPPNTTYYNLAKKNEIIKQINSWKASPFDPHKIAFLRPRAYMLWTVMEFVQNIIDWADSLFRQDTMESLHEALNLYVVASQLLGDRPKKVARPTPDCKSYDQIAALVDDFSNLLVEFENITIMGPGGGPPVNVTVTDLYFCIPANPKLLALWDLVEDRLFKIRHCMNIEGKKRELALFSPPIDPALLVRAAAAGLSIEDALEDLASPLPHYKFSYLVQKANEFNNDVKALGSQLLGTLEKKDAEELSLFRQIHEQNILRASRTLKLMAIDDAKQSVETLKKSKNLIQIRLLDYQNRKYINTRETTAQSFTKKAEDLALVEQGVRAVAGLLSLIPDLYASATPKIKVFGGSKLNTFVSAGANVLGIVSSVNRNKASMSLTFASYDRRQEDWNLQIKTATEELLQVDRQILSTEIKIAVAEKELQNHDLQIAQSEEMYDWLKEKYTNGNLYNWMAGQVKSVYKKTFNLAYDLAKRAQICLDYELGVTTPTNIVQFGQWDSTKSGLLAGESLALQLRQLEAKYIKENEREYEMSKNISLALLNPRKLDDLIMNGECTFELPEYLFDLDHAGQYKRRIKTVSISIPCIAGPNTNISAILTLNKAVIRPTGASNSYTPADPQSIPLESIMTSSAQNDSGVFELNFKDERYLPFEGKGAISEWTLTLSQISRGATADAIRAFDFHTISDVIIHMKYTAKYDGGLATAAKTYMLGNLATTGGSIELLGQNVLHAFSLRHDMPNEWHEFMQNGDVDFKIDKSRLPYILQALNPIMKSFDILVFPKTAVTGTPSVILSSTEPSYTFVPTTVNGNILSAATSQVKPTEVLYTLGTSTPMGKKINLEANNPAETNIEDIVIVTKIGLT
jgi:hypothetical protein